MINPRMRFLRYLQRQQYHESRPIVACTCQNILGRPWICKVHALIILFLCFETFEEVSCMRRHQYNDLKSKSHAILIQNVGMMLKLMIKLKKKLFLSSVPILRKADLDSYFGDASALPPTWICMALNSITVFWAYNQSVHQFIQVWFNTYLSYLFR